MEGTEASAPIGDSALDSGQTARGGAARRLGMIMRCPRRARARAATRNPWRCSGSRSSPRPELVVEHLAQFLGPVRRNDVPDHAPAARPPAVLVVMADQVCVVQISDSTS